MFTSNFRRRWPLASVTLTLTCALAFIGQAGSQDVGSFLAGLLGAADVPEMAGNNTLNEIPCPGECVHALTSILCSRVIEQFTCGASYLRCCVSSDYNFGTVVETSAPLPEDYSTESTTEYEVFLVTTEPSHETSTNDIYNSPPSSPVSVKHQPRPTSSIRTTTTTTTTTQKPGPCRGICVENIFVRYCGNTIAGWCEKGSTCCASNQDYDDPVAETTTLAIPITTNKIYENKHPTTQYSRYETSPVSTTTRAPICPGSCVAPLFSLLCDVVSDGYYCPNEGRCCMNNDEPSAPPTTTASNMDHLSNPCPGACIPMFLRGMCNRPSEIMLQSECEQEFVCCYQPDVKDQLHIESPQIPLLRPGSQQPGYPNIPLGSQNQGPQTNQPHMHYQYPQRPQIPFPGKPVPPVMVPHVHNQASANQGYLGGGHTGYGQIPQMQPHGNNGYVKPSYPQTNNYGNNEQPNFSIRPQSVNSSLETNPHRFTNVAQQPPIMPSRYDQPSQHIYEKRRQNFTHSTVLQNNHQPNVMHHDPSRFIPPSPIQNPKPVMQPEEPEGHRKQQNFPNRFVGASVGFAPGSLRPLSFDATNKSPSHDVFRPPNSQDNFVVNPIPNISSNASTIAGVTYVDNVPPHIYPEITSPSASESSQTAFIPLQESFRPIQNQQRPSPPIHAESVIPQRPQASSSDKMVPFKPPAPLSDSLIPFKPLVTDSEPVVPLKPQASASGSVIPIKTPGTGSEPMIPFKPPATASEPMVPFKPPASIPMASDTANKMVSTSTNLNNGTFKKMMPECPGSCIGSFLRFTCFGNSAIYDGFSCEPEGTLCCTSVEYIEKYEEHLKSGRPLVLKKPDESPKGEMSAEATRRPGMYVCGIKGNQRRKTGRVVGGKTSMPGEWCWQVALINAKNQYLCGGALIGSRWVLTAAHCITSLVRNGDAIYVRVGDYDLASQFGTPGAQTQKVSTSYIHHNHNGQTLDNDIALLRLENPVQLQESVCLVCLPARGAESHPGKRCTVTGYGYMDESGPIALKVREAVLPIVEEKLCTEQINKVTEKRFILPAGSFCAGGESGNDACQGDGGGPLTCINEGYHELTGLVSWGFGCGKENVPGVYVKVSSYIGWINQIISVNN